MNPESITTVLEHLQKRAVNGKISFATFMDGALYTEGAGYYQRKQNRVGKSRTDSDFYTATSLGPMLGQLLAQAARTLLGVDSLQDYRFVEIGAEPDAGVEGLEDADFAGRLSIPLGQDFDALSGNCVVFANELFDAQPFHRLQFCDGQWVEWGVKVENTPEWTKLDHLSEPVRKIADRLPESAPEGYRLDVPVAAEALLDRILEQSWQGAVIFCDYGKVWAELCQTCPEGTGRAYWKHQQSNDLLAQPGEQDLTCHICWDWLENTLRQHDFNDVQTLRQEAFFMRYASRVIEQTVRQSASGFNPAQRALMGLLHPAHMGHKFQVLCGRRL